MAWRQRVTTPGQPDRPVGEPVRRVARAHDVGRTHHDAAVAEGIEGQALTPGLADRVPLRQILGIGDLHARRAGLVEPPREVRVVDARRRREQVLAHRSLEQLGRLADPFGVGGRVIVPPRARWRRGRGMPPHHRRVDPGAGGTRVSDHTLRHPRCRITGVSHSIFPSSTSRPSAVAVKTLVLEPMSNRV